MARGLAALCLIASVAAPLGAQVQYGGQLSLVSRSEWRGITRVSGWSFQPGGFFTVGSAVRFAAGIWTHVQLADLDPTAGIGFGNQWFGEVNTWAEVSAESGSLDIAAGWIGYHFDDENAVTPERALVDTNELYVRTRVLSIPGLLPSLTYYHDIDAISGGYLEPALTLRLPFWPQAVLPLGSLYATAAVGFSLGQEADAADPSAVGHFGAGGLTHWDLSIEWPMQSVVELGPFKLSPELEFHLQLNRDPIGRVKTAMGSEDGATFWLRLGFNALGPRCRPQREICNP